MMVLRLTTIIKTVFIDSCHIFALPQISLLGLQ